MAVSRRAGGVGGIGAVALADLLGHWPTADGPLYRLLAERFGEPAGAADQDAAVGLRYPRACGCRPNATWPPPCP